MGEGEGDIEGLVVVGLDEVEFGQFIDEGIAPGIGVTGGDEVFPGIDATKVAGHVH